MAFEQKVPAVIVVKSLIIGFSAGDTRGSKKIQMEESCLTFFFKVLIMRYCIG